MTLDEINRAIAERLGIHAVCDENSNLWSLMDGRCLVHGTHNGGLDEEHCWRVNCPDYCNDLNAMAEVEKVFVDADDGSHGGCIRYVYARHLYSVVPRDRQPFMAKAHERAEAALRTFAEWRGV